MIVVDANILSYFFIPGEFSNSIEKLFKKDPVWYAPLLWRFEFQSVLAKYMKANLMNISHANALMEKSEHLLKGRELMIPSEMVLELAVHSGCTTYDCQYVAAAQLHKSVLITFDSKLLKSFPQTALLPDKFLK